MRIIIIVILILLLYLFITFLMFLLICRKFSNKILPMSSIVLETLKPFSSIIKVGNDWINQKYDNNEVKDVYIKSFDNLNLHGILIENKKSKGVLIEVHGYRSSAQNDLYASCYQYYNMGYSLLLIDQRTSNKSEGKYITFGIKESKDIINWIKFVNKKYHKKHIVLAGISMGASSVLMSLKYINKKMKIKCVLVDSGYVSPYEEVLYCIKHYFHINGKLFIGMINIWCQLLAKFDLKEENTISCIQKSKIPILFVHGLDDDFVPVINTKKNYENYNGIKEMVLFEGATHGISYLVDSEKYLNYIKKFVSD